MVAHDRGDSVALAWAARRARPPATEIRHLVLPNGNIFLSLSNLTLAQRLVLEPRAWPHVTAALTPQALAESMGAATFTPLQVLQETIQTWPSDRRTSRTG